MTITKYNPLDLTGLPRPRIIHRTSGRQIPLPYVLDEYGQNQRNMDKAHAEGLCDVCGISPPEDETFMFAYMHAEGGIRIMPSLLHRLCAQITQEHCPAIPRRNAFLLKRIVVNDGYEYELIT